MRKTEENKKSIHNKFAFHPLQSWEWGEFRRAWGNDVVRTQVKSDRYVDSLQVVITKIPRTGFGIGTALRGPMPTKEILNALLKIAKEQNLIFIKLEPFYAVKKGGISCADEKKVVEILKDAGATPGKTLFTPTSFWIDLTKSDEELLKSFHPKTRYKIRIKPLKNILS